VTWILLRRIIASRCQQLTCMNLQLPPSLIFEMKMCLNSIDSCLNLMCIYLERMRLRYFLPIQIQWKTSMSIMNRSPRKTLLPMLLRLWWNMRTKEFFFSQIYRSINNAWGQHFCINFDEGTWLVRQQPIYEASKKKSRHVRSSKDTTEYCSVAD
jgi:hypothetical protein